MKIWVMQCLYAGDLTCSTHLTEKGAIIAGICDMLTFCGVDSQESAEGEIADRFTGHPDEAPTSEEITNLWNRDAFKSKEVRELWTIFSFWNQCLWDNQQGYDVDVSAAMLEA